jgi:hypothetical protein
MYQMYTFPRNKKIYSMQTKLPIKGTTQDISLARVNDLQTPQVGSILYLRFPSHPDQ